MVRQPGGDALDCSTIVAEPTDGQRELVDSWLTESLTAALAGPGAVMLCMASTARLTVSNFENRSILRAECEDMSGTFFSGFVPYEIRDGATEWGKVKQSDGFSRAHRLWPRPALKPPPRRPGDGIPSEAKQAGEDIETFCRTGYSLFTLDSAIDRIEAFLRDYDWDPADEVYLASKFMLCRGLSARFLRIGDRSDSSRAIDGLRDLVEADIVSRWCDRAYSELVRALTASHHRSGRAAPLDEAIERGEDRLKTLGGDPLTDPYLSVAVAQALLDRHMLYGLWADAQRAFEIVQGLTQQSWNDVDWAGPAFDCLRTLLERTERFAAERILRSARVPYSLVFSRGDLGDEAYRYVAAFATALVRAYIETKNEEYLREALETSEETLGLDSNDTPRLSYSSPYRPALLEAWAAALECLDGTVDSDLKAFDPDGARLVHAREELVIMAPAGSPGRALALDRLATVRLLREDPSGARAALRDAIDCWEDSFATASIVHRLGQVDLGTRLYAQLFALSATTFIKETAQGSDERRDGLWEQLALIDAPKSRLLTVAIGRGDLPAPSTAPTELIERERELLVALAAFDNHNLAAATSADRIQKRADASLRDELLAKLHETWDLIEQVDAGTSEYVALRRGRPLKRDQLQQLIADLGPRTTVVSTLDALGSTDFVLADGDAPAPVVLGGLVPSRDWSAIVGRMWREIPLSHGHDRGQTWLQLLAPALDRLAEFTADADRLVVSPHGLTHALAWPVIAWELERRRDRPLSLVLEPTLGVLDRVRRRAAASSSEALVVGDPLGDLPFAREEATAVAGLLGVTALIGEDAVRATVEASTLNGRVIHLAAHAGFDADDPLGSAVQLADGPWTARDLIATTLTSEMVVLSACESGRVEPLSGDEVAGLSTAILHAGARRVLVTLWPVDDQAAALFMENFYDGLDGDLDCGDAVRAAARAVQAHPGYAHPYYWGGYVLIGDFTWTRGDRASTDQRRNDRPC